MKGKKLLYKILLLLLPILIVLASYFIYDPFKVLYTYDNYPEDHVELNRNHVSTEIFLKNYNEYQFNSFIFGSSRSMAFRTDSWHKHLQKKDEVYHYNAWSEKIEEVSKKMTFLDKKGVKMENILLVLDWQFFAKQASSHTHMGHYSVNETSYLSYQKKFLLTYFQDNFWLKYLWYKCSNNFQAKMTPSLKLLESRFDSVRNDIYFFTRDTALQNHPDAYYTKKGLSTEPVFFAPENLEFDLKLGKGHIDESLIHFKEIKALLDKHQSHYKVILSPLYDRTTLHPNDINKIKEILRADHFYDYSGKNEITENKRNYYEFSHFKPEIGNQILEEIYQE